MRRRRRRQGLHSSALKKISFAKIEKEKNKMKPSRIDIDASLKEDQNAYGSRNADDGVDDDIYLSQIYKWSVVCSITSCAGCAMRISVRALNY